MKKSLIITIISVFLVFNSVNAQWKMEICPTNEHLNAITATNTGTMWIAGNMGTLLYKKHDGWNAFPKPTTENLNSIFFVSENNGWAVGSGGCILHFNGTDWESIASPTKRDLYNVKFRDKDNGVAVGMLGTLLIYRNGKWLDSKNESKGNFYAVDLIRDNTWIGGGLECITFPILRIKNLGPENTALTKEADFFASINSIDFINSSDAWAVGSPSIILHYDGTGWRNQLISGQFPTLNSLFFLNDSNGICVGYNGTILQYSGDNWAKEFSGVTQNLKGTVITENALFAVGENGTILSKMTNSQDNSMPKESTTGSVSGNTGIAGNITLTSDQGLYDVTLFPNPCDQLMNVKITSAEQLEKGTIIITNIDGKVLFQQKINFRETSPSFIIDTELFDSGMYFMQAVIGDNSASVSFIVRH